VEPKLLSIPKAAKVIGEDEETIREWVNRTVDPLPHRVTSKPTAERVHRKIVMSLVDDWLERNSIGGNSRCS